MKYREQHNREKDKDVEKWRSLDELGAGKASRHSFSKIFAFLPIALVVSCLVIIVTIWGIPSTMDFAKSILDKINGNHEELKGAPPESLFVDVEATSKYFDSLAFLKKNGVINGYEDNTFKPEQELKRAELVKIIVNAKKSYPLALNYNNCFKDVGNEWYAASICMAKEKAWVGGYEDGSFHPNDNLTRAEALKIVLTAFEIKKNDEVLPADSFEDVDPKAWYADYVATAMQRKLIEDNPNIEFFKPDQPAIRGEVAQLIYRVMQL